MPRPELGSFAEDHYRRLEPFHCHTLAGRPMSDEELGWPLLIFYGAMARRWQRVHDLSTDTDAGSAWSSLVDIDRAEDDGLPFLSQFKGVTLLDGLTPDQQRDRIRNVDGFQRCTASAIKEATKRRLTGNKTVYLNEREGGNAYRIGVVTFIDETPDPAGTYRDIVEQKPWGYIVNYSVVDAWNYQVLKVAFDNYGEIKLHYADYEGLKENDPPAPTI